MEVWNNTDVPVLIIIMSSKTFQVTILIISFIAKISKDKKATIRTFDILVWNIVVEYVCMYAQFPEGPLCGNEKVSMMQQLMWYLKSLFCLE